MRPLPLYLKGPVPFRFRSDTHVRICSKTRRGHRARRTQGPAAHRQLQEVAVRARRGRWRVARQDHPGPVPEPGQEGTGAILRSPARRVLTRSSSGARGVEGVRRGAVGREPGGAQHCRRAAAPGVAAAAEPRARRHGNDSAHARAPVGTATRAERARRRRPGLPSPAVVVVQPRLPADRSRGLAHTGLPARADHPSRSGARDSRVERPAPAAGGRPSMLRLLPPGAARTSR